MTDIDPWAPPAPIGPHITAQDVTEWQQLAWTMLADDAGVDLTTVTENVDWQDEAERKFGQVAAAQIRAYDALMTIRFGPETSQGPAVASAVLVDVPAAQVDTAERFARTVQNLTTTHDNDWELRDEAILALALEYAGQFLPAGRVVEPPLSQQNAVVR